MATIPLLSGGTCGLDFPANFRHVDEPILMVARFLLKNVGRANRLIVLTIPQPFATAQLWQRQQSESPLTGESLKITVLVGAPRPLQTFYQPLTPR